MPGKYRFTKIVSAEMLKVIAIKNQNMKTALIFLFLTIVPYFGACSAKNAGISSLRCNLYVRDIMREKNIYLPSSSANDIYIYLHSCSLWRKIPRAANGKLNHKAAYAAAKSGKYVLAAYNGGRKNGHVAIVDGRKGFFYSKGYNDYVPYACGSVKGRTPELVPLSYQFSADKEPAMNYFIYEKH